MPDRRVETPEAIARNYGQALDDCRKLYWSSAEECSRTHPDLVQTSPEEFLSLMSDLYRGLAVKIYITMVEADRRWSMAERELGSILLEKIWNRRLEGDELREAVKELAERSESLKWYSLVRPFEQIAPLRNRIGELETVVMRMANLVAKADGKICPDELPRLRAIQEEIDRHLRPLPLNGRRDHSDEQKAGAEAVQQLRQEVQAAREGLPERKQPADKLPQKSREQLLAEAMAELDGLIGLDNIKSDVKSLVNFLKVQEEREKSGLPRTDVSLHMLFYGNPGTGKTTVARIVGQLFGAMGVLKKGHLIETDRSGMVAGYVGQTAIKANKKIDEALDGVLFIDEAYSLVAERGDDAYGPEAIQTLLKRMEDDRRRLVIILAGYPEPMDRLLDSNPGLSSRFNRKFDFPDYAVLQLAEIFASMCEKNHYVLPGATRAKLLLGFQYLFDERDERFGNGRLVRNVFESSIRQLANRVAAIVPLTKELLTTLEPADIALPEVPRDVLASLDDERLRFQVSCPGCKELSSTRQQHLGRRMKCNRCDHRFRVDWGVPLVPDTHA